MAEQPEWVNRAARSGNPVSIASGSAQKALALLLEEDLKELLRLGIPTLLATRIKENSYALGFRRGFDKARSTGLRNVIEFEEYCQLSQRKENLSAKEREVLQLIERHPKDEPIDTCKRLDKLGRATMRPLAVRPSWASQRAKVPGGTRPLSTRDEWEVAYTVPAVRVFLSELRTLAREHALLKKWRESFDLETSRFQESEAVSERSIAKIRSNIDRLKKLRKSGPAKRSRTTDKKDQ